MKKQYFINANIIDPHNSINETGGLIISEEGKIEAVGKKVAEHLSETLKIESIGKSSNILKETKSVGIVINGKFYQKLEKSHLIWINQNKPLGFGDAVKRAEKYVGKEDFIVHAGDVTILSNSKHPISRLIDTAKKHPEAKAILLCKKVKDSKRYGVPTIEKLSNVKGLHIYGTKDISKRGGVISFNFADVHPHDVAQIIDEEGIAVRSGHHCAQVLMERLNVAATSRASFYIYNTKEDIDVLVNSLNTVAKVFKL